MKEAAVYKQDGSRGAAVKLPDALFSLPWNGALVHQVVTGIAANRRSGTAKVKIRSEVKGGGRKPWRQKGTGRARHGSIRSPLWVGGGVTFGPDNRKNYGAVINRKMRAGAFFTVLSRKAEHDAVEFIENLAFEKPSTKNAAKCIEKICGVSGDGGKNVCTVVFSEKNEEARKSFRNIRGVTTVPLDALNALNALAAKKILFVNPSETLKKLEARAAAARKEKRV